MRLLTEQGGRYTYLPAISPYSSGVSACEGYEVVWVNLRRPMRLADGIGRAAKVAREMAGAPRAVCAFALRNPARLTMDDFAVFNARYRDLLDANGILPVDAENPIARTNVVPTVGTPSESVVHGFGVLRPVNGPRPRSFVVAGAAELRNQELHEDAVVSPGDTSPAGLAAKAAAVLDEMERRLDGLGATWEEVTAVNVYTDLDLAAIKHQVLERLAGTAVHGLRWFPSRPPVAGLDFEMDVRGVREERVL